MTVLINALGIQDSGGITVLEKVLEECNERDKNLYIVIANENKNMGLLINKYSSSIIKFKTIVSKKFLHRIYYENFKFIKIVRDEKVDLIYNFSGSAQIYLKTPQLLKIQNLLFYSRKLDNFYKSIWTWVKQIYLKRIVFKTMAQNSICFEVQSSHVQEYMSYFIDTTNKSFYIKSDIDVDNELFFTPKEFDFKKKIKFLYIVGPHFEYTHKNFIDFTNVMLELNKNNIDFEINITLTKGELNASSLWNNCLDNRTNFLGYVSDKNKMKEIFSDNSILISTSIIETLGLHVIEAIKYGIIPIVPNEEYSKSVYGDNIMAYELSNTKSLLNAIFSIINDTIDCREYVVTLQNDLKISEKNKYKNITDIFQKVIDVQK